MDETFQITPKLLPGTIIEVTDVGVKVALKGRMGIVSVPLRGVITNKKLEQGLPIQVYFSYIQVL
ncbi:MAG: CBO2463/CBO2479 domain-containing protein [Sporolactobacillus sp.]